MEGEDYACIFGKNENKKSARQRAITDLVHFTDIENVESIMSRGLLTRNFMDDNQIPYYYNDSFRYDNLCGAISLSVTFPNYKMFYKLRCDNPEKRWGIIILKAEKILDLDCIFCRTNAANSDMSNIPVSQRRTFNAFEDMFYERNDISRENMGLPDNYTTDPQAEILVRNNISPSYVKRIYVFNTSDVEYLNGKEINACVNADYFQPRCDYSRW